MSAHIDIPALQTRIKDLPGLAAAERAEAVAEILATLAPVVERWAWQACVKHGDDTGRHAEDASQEALLSLWRVLLASGSGSHPGVTAWFAYLHGVANRAAGAFLESSAVQPASGMIGIRRRLWRLAVVRGELERETGGQPTPQQVAERANRQLAERWADPSKNGQPFSAAEAREVLFQSAR